MTRAVVFAYHDVGVRCLAVLLAHGIEVPLVMTHDDDPSETIWFGSVARLAADNHLPCAAPADPNTAEWVERVRRLEPDLLFSFYYRRMLSPRLLAVPRLGAYNMHGSLLPRYRGRAPVNWAVIHGERETGATLHAMVEKPDAGPIAAQQAVPILPDDTALNVFHKVTVAAEMVLYGALPRIVDGSIALVDQDLKQGSYFGGRTPADGRIDWQSSALSVHNLIRGVAPPYPGAFTEAFGDRLRVLRSRLDPAAAERPTAPCLYLDGERVRALCADGSSLTLLEIEHRGQTLDAAGFRRLFGADQVSITNPPGRRPAIGS